jgi:hypothetical protein
MYYPALFSEEPSSARRLTLDAVDDGHNCIRIDCRIEADAASYERRTLP